MQFLLLIQTIIKYGPIVKDLIAVLNDMRKIFTTFKSDPTKAESMLKDAEGKTASLRTRVESLGVINLTNVVPVTTASRPAGSIDEDAKYHSIGLGLGVLAVLFGAEVAATMISSMDEGKYSRAMEAIGQTKMSEIDYINMIVCRLTNNMSLVRHSEWLSHVFICAATVSAKRYRHYVDKSSSLSSWILDPADSITLKDNEVYALSYPVLAAARGDVLSMIPEDKINTEDGQAEDVSIWDQLKNWMTSNTATVANEFAPNLPAVTIATLTQNMANDTDGCSDLQPVTGYYTYNQLFKPNLLRR